MFNKGLRCFELTGIPNAKQIDPENVLTGIFDALSARLRWRKQLVLETTKRYYRVDRSQIAFLRFIFEAYDGIAVVTTVDPQKGIIEVHIPPGCENDADFILHDLKKDIMIEPTNIFIK